MPSVSFKGGAGSSAGADLSVRLRPVEPADKPFLFELFRAIRAPRLDFQPGGHPQMAPMIRLQFQALEHALAANFPHANHSLLVAVGVPVGRIMESRTPTEVQLVDISLLPARQRQGIGSLVVEGLLDQARAEHLPVRCQVQQNNPGGYIFFRSLGFHLVAHDTAYAHLEWKP